MPDRPLRMSRRRLLQTGSMAPLSALLLAGTATYEQVILVAKKLPVSTENELWDKAKDPILGADQTNFRSAVRILFESFADGAEDNALVVPSQGSAHRHLVLEVAWNQKNEDKEKSGVLIARRSPHWRNQMNATLSCAYRCGAEFANAAPDFDKPESVEKAYATAYGIVENTMKTLLRRARSIGKDRPTAERDVGAFAAGC